MSRIRYVILLCLLLVCRTVSFCAEETSVEKTARENPLRFSLLTCTPGTDAYAHFGHTAILLEDTAGKQDAVFNYGCFDDTQKHFVLNFMAGNTNYLLDAEPLDFFLWRYGVTGNGVTRQELNLTAEETRRLVQLLAVNIRKENQTYLYNWLYDNCTERARDVIEKAIDGSVEYEREAEELTVRQMLHEKLRTAPWLQLGIDIILGEEIDRNVGKRIQMFMPDFFEAELSQAVIEGRDGVRRPLVKAEERMQEATELSREVPSPVGPMLTFTCLLAIVAGITAFDLWRRKLTLWLDVLMLTAQGVTGIVVAGLFLFSKHPAVDSNWMVVLMNPLYFLLAFILIYNRTTGKAEGVTKGAEYVNMAVLVAFVMIMAVGSQWFNPAVWLMVSALLLRSGGRIAIRRINERNR